MPLRLQSSKAHPARARYEKIECCIAKFGTKLSDTLTPTFHDTFLKRFHSFSGVAIRERGCRLRNQFDLRQHRQMVRQACGIARDRA
jgi:hypothetical protein